MNTYRLLPTFGILLLLLVHGGCTMLGPDFQQPDSRLPEGWSEEGNDLFRKVSMNESLGWWEEFNDPVLNELIQLAYLQNLDLRSAALRIYESRAALAKVKGTIYPQAQELNGELFTIGTKGPAEDRNYNSASIGFDVAWEMDFWGKFRRSIESADAGLLSSIADYEDILVSLTAEVARSYIDIRTLQERIYLARRNAELQTKSLNLVKLQLEAGVVTELDMLQAKNLLASTLATIPNLRSALSTTQHSLSLLLGMLPGEVEPLLARASGIPEQPPGIAIALPADLLRRRPDIRRAEMLAAAQSARIGIARADLYPSFTLFGSIGINSTDRGGESLGDLFDSDSFSYNFGPAFKWSLFNYGRLKNEVRIQDARFQQALVAYQNAVLNSSREVEDAMRGLVFAREEAELLSNAVEASKRSAELSMLQYNEGLADYQRVLDSIRALTQKEDQYAEVTGKIANFTIALYKAFGGGWQEATEPYLPEPIRKQMTHRTDWAGYLEPKGQEDSD